MFCLDIPKAIDRLKKFYGAHQLDSNLSLSLRVLTSWSLSSLLNQINRIHRIDPLELSCFSIHNLSLASRHSPRYRKIATTTTMTTTTTTTFPFLLNLGLMPVWNVRFSCAGRIFILNVVCAMNPEIYT